MKEGEPIFSGPQANPDVLNTPNPGVQPVFSAPSQSTQPTQPAPQPIASGAVDAVFDNSKTKNQKNVFLIIMAVLIAVIIVGFGAYSLISRQNNTNETQENNTIDQNFYIFANNLLFGEEKTDPISDFDTEDSFYIDENYEDNNYLKTLLNNYDTFLTQAEYDNELKALPIRDSKNQIEFLIQYNELGFIDNGVVLDAYYSESPEAAKALVKEYYKIYDTDSDLIKTIKDYEKRVALNKILVLSDESSSDVTEEIMDKIYDLLESSIQELKDTCKNINLIMNGDDDE